jgi:hypothetical protein
MALILSAFEEFHEEASPAQQIMAVLLLNASDTVIAAAGTLRSGYRLQPGILLRNVIETLCTVSYMCVVPDAVVEYKSGRLRSQSTIGKANEVLPLFGRMYGFFSERYAHLSEMHGSFHSPGRYEAGEVGGRMNLALIRLVVVLFKIVTELAFITFVSDPTYWRRVGDGRIAFDPGGAIQADIEFIVDDDPDLKGRL